MFYKRESNKITILDNAQFVPQHILECGQIFRYKKQDDGSYVVCSADKRATITQNGAEYIISSKDIEYFENFFDLKTDYAKIKSVLSAKSDILRQATQFGSGIRILRQPPLEMIVSFIISANNNIARIQSLVEKLCQKCGTNMGDFFAFPTLDQLLTLSVDDLRRMGMGFRAKYIHSTVRALQQKNLDGLRDMQTDERLQYLQTLSGIGPKVADCIALFAYHDMNCFPVDVWVEKVYNSYFAKEAQKNRAKIRKELTSTFGELSGYAQQYLFYFKRELDKR